VDFRRGGRRGQTICIWKVEERILRLVASMLVIAK